MMKNKKGSIHTTLFVIVFIVVAIIVATTVFDVNAVSYEKEVETIDIEVVKEEVEIAPVEELFVATHIAMPDAVKGVYMSSWVAATPSLRNKIVDMVERTEINALVIDIKDSTGKISFPIDNQTITQYSSSENRIRNIKELIADLHEKNIYVIGRVSVFQDPYLAVNYPALAITNKSNGDVWKDRKGLSFLDPNNKDVWDYTVAIAQESYDIGFDEINFDYIRFPSDGDISDINYGIKEGETRADIIEKFFTYLRSQLVNKEYSIPMSADLFGMVTSVNDDLGIGQVLEKALPHFDAIAPMIYPSHYPKNWNGYSNPAANPYEVVHKAMGQGLAKSNPLGYTADVYRPWIQDFNMGATYTAEMVEAQIKALDDLGIDSWLVWDPANTYTEAAFDDADSVLE